MRLSLLEKVSQFGVCVRKKQSWVLCVLVTVLLLPILAQSAPHCWVGTYQWLEDNGKRANGLGTFVEYTVKVDSKDGILKASVIEEGYQTHATLLCDTTMSGNSLNILFSSYSSGKVENAYGVKLYEKGQRLFTLKRIKKGGTFLTYWGALITNTKPVDGNVYFKKL
jgi:hypothetical protein